jgi:hypothetical protein
MTRGRHRGGSYFVPRTPIAQEITARTDKWDLIKLKSFCTAKENNNNKKNPVTVESLQNGRKTCNYSSNRRFISTISKEFRKLNVKGINNLIHK